MPNVYKGKVIRYIKSRGYGFVQYLDGNEMKEIFIQASSFPKGVKILKVGQYIRFTVGENDRGPIAENVEVVFNAKVKTNTGTNREKKI